MVNHFTPIGNHPKRTTMKNDGLALSIDIDSRLPGVFKRKGYETYLQHLKRICNISKQMMIFDVAAFTESARTSIERACLFLAIFELQIQAKESLSLRNRFKRLIGKK